MVFPSEKSAFIYISSKDIYSVYTMEVDMRYFHCLTVRNIISVHIWESWDAHYQYLHFIHLHFVVTIRWQLEVRIVTRRTEFVAGYDEKRVRSQLFK